jgi:hypothetical protein
MCLRAVAKEKRRDGIFSRLFFPQQGIDARQLEMSMNYAFKSNLSPCSKRLKQTKAPISLENRLKK